MVARELLEALGLAGTPEEILRRFPGARLLDVPQDIAGFAKSHGIVIKEIELPPRPLQVPPIDGVDILRNELARTDRFHLLYSAEGYLDAIVPAVDGPSRESTWCFFDLTPYYIDLKRQTSLTDSEWVEYARQIGSRREVVSEYLQFRRLSAWIRPTEMIGKKPYVLATLDTKTGGINLQQFESGDFLNEERRVALQHRLSKDPNKKRIIFPVFPTVYSPGIENNVAQGQNFGGHVHRYLKTMELADRDKVLDVGTGSGYLAWVAWSTARASGHDAEMYAIDINPLSIANARVMARLAGYQVTARVYDNVVDANGKYAFPDTRFRYVIWDMPTIPRIVKPYLNAAPDAHGARRLMTYWDDGLGALETLRRFASALPTLLDPGDPAPSGNSHPRRPGAAVIWNTVPEDGADIVGGSFRSEGLKTDLLETYSAGRGTVTCVVYAVSRQGSEHQ